MKIDKSQIDYGKYFIILIACALSISIFFHQQIANDFTVLLGDRYDGVILAALLEHWFNYFQGLADWRSPNYFYPYDATLSYNEGLFVYGAIYSLFRYLSIDPLLSSELVSVTIKAVGFIGFYLAARRLFHTSFLWSLFGASVFTITNSSFVLGIHAQLLTVSFAPIQAILFFEFAGALLRSDRKRLLIWGAASIFLLAAWMMTCLYMSYFFVLFLMIVLLVQFAVGGLPLIVKISRAVVENKFPLFVLTLVAAASLFPFASVYLRGFGSEKHRVWEEILPYVPSVFDVLNVGENNFIFGRLVGFAQRTCQICDIGPRGLDVGFGPILFLITGLCILDVFRKKLLIAHEERLLVLGTTVGLLVAWLISLKISGHTLWYFIYTLVPGAEGLRVVSRFQLLLTAPVVMLAIYWLSKVTVSWNKPIVLVLCGVLLVEEINTSSTVRLDRMAELSRTVSLATPPAECQAFFITTAADQSKMDSGFVIGALYSHNVDAMLIAEHFNLPTINGYASFNPSDWNFGYPTKHEYEMRIYKYASTHGISRLCRLDPIANRWSTFSLLSPPILPCQKTFNFSRMDEVLDSISSGFSNSEPFGRWSMGNRGTFTCKLDADLASAQRIHIVIATALVTGSHQQRLFVSINNGKKHEYVFSSVDKMDIELPIDASENHVVSVNFEFPDAITPLKLGINGDTRVLAVAIESISIM